MSSYICDTVRLGDESRKENQALDAAQRTLTLSMSRYRDGVVSYLDVVTAQTTELDAQIATLNLYTRRLRASVAFIQALGGGWTTARTSPVRCVGNGTQRLRVSMKNPSFTRFDFDRAGSVF
jgi:hypothetical protein